jgi:PBS lyase HEAT-like repeat
LAAISSKGGEQLRRGWRFGNEDVVDSWLKDPEVEARGAAAAALGTIGAAGEKAVPDLVALLKDREARAGALPKLAFLLRSTRGCSQMI